MKGFLSFGSRPTAVLLVASLLLAILAGCAQPKPSKQDGTPQPAPTTATQVSTIGETLTPTFAPFPTPAETTETPAGSPTATDLPTPAGTLPAPTALAAATPAPQLPTATPVPGATYTVQWGDTLFSIAVRFGVSIEAIQAANNMGSSTLITIGQILAIPGGVPGEAPGTAPQIYVVQSGDTAFSIAQRFNTTVDAIAWANQLVNPWNIYGGQELVIPEGDETGSSPAGGGVHVVQPGESLYSIATAYNTTVWAIAVANNLPNPQVIYVGERLLIP